MLNESTTHHIVQLQTVWIRYTILAVMLTVYCCMVGVSADDRDYQARRVLDESGQPLPTIHCIFQDKLGFMWFGTTQGLVRYDGHTFRTYRHDPSDSRSISGPTVTCITEDTSGCIWAGTRESGLNRVDRRTNRVTRIRVHSDALTSIQSEHVTALASDRHGNVWIGTDKGLSKFDRKTGRVVRCKLPNDHTNVRVTSLLVTVSDEVWVTYHVTDRDLLRVSSFLAYTRTLAVSFRGHLVDTTRGHTILGGNSQGVLLGSKYLTKPAFHLDLTFHRGTQSPRPIGLSVPLNDRVDAHLLLLDRDSTLWYAVASQSRGARGISMMFELRSFTMASRDSVRVRSARNAKPLLRGEITCMLQDRSGRIWVGTNDGIYSLHRRDHGFTIHDFDPSDAGSLSAAHVRALHVDSSGKTWVGTDYGLNSKKPGASSWRHYFPNPNQPNSIANSVINVISKDTDGTLLIGTHGGVSRYVASHDRFETAFPHLVWRKGASPRIWSILCDTHDRVWIGSSGSGVVRWDRAKRHATWFNHHPSDSTSIASDDIWCSTKTSNGTIWMGTNDGLCKWIPELGAFKQYRHQPMQPRSIAGNRVWSVFEDRQHRVWALSFGGGLSRYIPETDDFVNVTTKNGLPTSDVVSMLEADDGTFWISSMQGLIHWTPAQNLFRSFDVNDGLQGNVFSFKSAFKNHDGTMLFGSANGLTEFHPALLQRNSNKPAVVVTAFRLFDSLTTTELFDGDTVQLKHEQNFFTFEFAALDFANPGQNQFAYMLEGIDPVWVHTNSAHRLASYTNLAPGKYLFKVRGSNRDGIWNLKGVAIMVIIEPPWWGTWTFRASVAILIFGLIFVFVRYRTNVIRKNERDKLTTSVQVTLETQEAERQRIARDLHDGIGQLIAAAVINVGRVRDIVDKQSYSQTNADLREPLDKAAFILSRTSDDVRALSHALGTSTLRELGLVAALGELLSYVAAQERTEFEFIAIGLETRMSDVVETGLFRIAQELVTNILRHAKATHASVQVLRDVHEVRLSVEDNGIGFDTQGPVSGMGLRNIAARVDAIGGELHYDSNIGHGTTVTVVVRS